MTELVDVDQATASDDMAGVVAAMMSDDMAGVTAAVHLAACAATATATADVLGGGAARADVLGGGAATTAATGDDGAAVLAAGAAPSAVGRLDGEGRGGVDGGGVGEGVLLGGARRSLFVTSLATASLAPAARHGAVAPGLCAVANAGGTA